MVNLDDSASYQVAVFEGNDGAHHGGFKFRLGEIVGHNLARDVVSFGIEGAHSFGRERGCYLGHGIHFQGDRAGIR